MPIQSLRPNPTKLYGGAIDGGLLILVLAMTPVRFAELKSDFEFAAQKFETVESLDERLEILHQIHQIITEFGELVEDAQLKVFARGVSGKVRK